MEHDRIVALVDRGQPVAEMQGVRIDMPRQKIEKIRAVIVVVRRTMLNRLLAPIVKFERFASLHIACEYTQRFAAHTGELLAEAERQQDFCRVGAGVERGSGLT